MPDFKEAFSLVSGPSFKMLYRSSMRIFLVNYLKLAQFSPRLANHSILNTTSISPRSKEKSLVEFFSPRITNIIHYFSAHKYSYAKIYIITYISSHMKIFRNNISKVSNSSMTNFCIMKNFNIAIHPPKPLMRTLEIL